MKTREERKYSSYDSVGLARRTAKPENRSNPISTFDSIGAHYGFSRRGKIIGLGSSCATVSTERIRYRIFILPGAYFIIFTFLYLTQEAGSENRVVLFATVFVYSTEICVKSRSDTSIFYFSNRIENTRMYLCTARYAYLGIGNEKSRRSRARLPVARIFRSNTRPRVLSHPFSSFFHFLKISFVNGARTWLVLVAP